MEQHSTVSSCLIRLNQVFIDLLASQQRLNHVFKSFVSIMQSREEVSLTRLTVVLANLLQSILQLSIPKTHGNQLWPTSRKFFFCMYLFYLELCFLVQGPRMSFVRYLIFCYLARYLFACSYDDLPSSFFSLLSADNSFNQSWLMLMT